MGGRPPPPPPPPLPLPSPPSLPPLSRPSPPVLCFLFRALVWPAGGTLAGGLRFSLDLRFLWVSRSVGLRSAVEVLGFSGLLAVASELHWTVNGCPSVARTLRASGSLLFGVASSPAKESL
ncbi:hypothetical protein RHGRI_036762 [Rhododendron griersonianum]|uniref:Uncharacterized protein n=1 Tax=Rhododendron griersonianum TaxID=479676 RepID=A0AAV6HPP5_9ERIC|nr:hypothetical protein RHGRI_036762 [Rhododendron griersonianum]